MELRKFVKKFGIENPEDFANWLTFSGFNFTKDHPDDPSIHWNISESQNFEEIVRKFRANESLIGEDVRRLKEEKQLAEQKTEEEKQLAEVKKRDYEEKKSAALANMLITSGFNFDGYTITKYSGYISGDDAVQVDRGTTGWFGMTSVDVGEKLMESLVHIRRNALAELKEAAYALGCNAVIGVDYDYITLDPETANYKGGTTYLPYVFGVTANGNAVIIEKNK